MHKKLILTLAIVALAAASFFVYKNKSKEELPKDDNANQEVTIETYSNENLGITLSHPSNLNLDEADDGRVTFSMFGPSQTEFTEVFDGTGVSFFRGEYTADNFKNFVDQSIVDWEVNGTVTDALKEVKLADKDGYTFEGTGVGKYRFYLLPVGEKQAIQIVVFVMDPTGQGFQDVVDNMLASLAIN